MTVHLLDANVLIALIDRLHSFHAAAERWFAANWSGGWATCPLTENATVRIVGHRRYGNYFQPPEAVATQLRDLTQLPGHEFWRDDISLLDLARIDSMRLRTPAQITDTYLLALAVAHGGKLATFDHRLATDAVAGGAEALQLIAAD